MEFAILDVSGCAFHEDGEFVFRSREPWDAFVEEYCGGEDPEDGSTDFEGDMIAGVVVSGSGCDGAVEPVSILECPFLLEFRFHPVFEGTCTAVITSTLFVRLPRSVLPVKFIEVP